MISNEYISDKLKNTYNFSVNDIDKISKFCRELLYFNKKYNLISKSTEKSILHRHVLDSAQLLAFFKFKEGSSLSDFGTGGGFPGLILAALYIIYILVRCSIWPEDGRRLPPDENEPPLARKLWITAEALLPPLTLIFAVLGTIILGWATPTEAAAMGAFGTIVLTLVYGRLSFSVFA